MRLVSTIFIGVMLLLTLAPAAVADAPQKPVTPGELREITLVHYAKPDNPGKPPAPEPPPVDNSGYALMGLYLPSTFDYYVNLSGAPAGAFAEMEQSFQTWDSTVTPTLFGSLGLTGKAGLALDGQNTVSWVRIAPKSTIAVTRLWYDPYVTDSQGFHPVVEADIAFNAFLPCGIDPDDEGPIMLKGAYDVQNIATHEVGHVVGLADLYEDKYRELTMYGYGAKGETLKISLEGGDITGAGVLYN